MDTRSATHADIDTLTDEELLELAKRVREIKGETVEGEKLSLMAKTFFD